VCQEGNVAVNNVNVIKGGLVAGLVANVMDFVAFGVLLKDSMKTEMDALNPALSAKMMATNSMVTGIVCDFVLGIMMVWTYAAIRGAYGPGPKTAVRAGLIFWVTFGIAYLGQTVGGMWSMDFFWKASAIGLINTLVSVNAGAAIYKE
jgi:hypothetical protein